ncbi:MAG: alpha-glucan family phosphorylase [Chthonomonadaceae bacterium]|nr:alpha-glucan family phosphorylase [Chthonomonadaceae bacterium]
MPNAKHAFHVVPDLPEPISKLHDIAHNLRWAWDHESIELFRRLDRNLWEKTSHNPVKMLGTISQTRLKDAAQDEAFLAQLERVARSNYAYLNSTTTWFKRTHPELLTIGFNIAYFSMEFGITECLPVYSGGLGVLAGDHMKSSSDLDLPLAGVGLLYQQGYFRQYLNAEGWQQQRYPENDFYNMPIEAVRDKDGKPLTVCVDLPGRGITIKVWKAQVGRVPLYLLDTNIPENSPEDQNITDQLYGGGEEMRLHQELVLGIGGLRALTAMGIKPSICHMNEGHAAFMALERIRMIMAEKGVDFKTAQEAASAGNLFTTHTPVPAGFDMFTPDLLRRYFEGYIMPLGISFDEFMALGQVFPDPKDKFNMAILALKNAHQCNGVSALHGDVTRNMVQSLYSGFETHEVPVGHVTNGIHTRSFISGEMADLLDHYLGGKWYQDTSDKSVWAKVDDIPDEELWRVKEYRREKLVQFARKRLRTQYEQRGMGDNEIRNVSEALNPNILTIGFARRFATYKRAAMILSDPERLLRILNDPNRPVQILMSGKAHPKDDGGKQLIQQIVEFARRPEARNRILFIEDYDMAVARHLVQGVDVWLNNPRRPMEASGTSGMKVLANGGLNCSIPDGWWAEGYALGEDLGWSIGKGEEYNDPDHQDHVEATALYEILERDIVPLFYDRNAEGTPRAWIARMKNSMRILCPVYNTHRMVSEYATTYYVTAGKRYHHLIESDLAPAHSLVEWKRKVQDNWSQVRVEKVETPTLSADASVKVGTPLKIMATVHLGGIAPGDVVVQAHHGLLDVNHHIVGGDTDTLEWTHEENGSHRYEGVIPCQISGQQGISVRVLPTHPDAMLPMELPLVAWE